MSPAAALSQTHGLCQPKLIQPVIRSSQHRRYGKEHQPVSLSLRTVEDLLAERGIDICHETVRLWWNRFGPMFAAEIRRKRVQMMRA